MDALWQQLRQKETVTKDKDRLESLWRNVQSGTQRHSMPTKPLRQQQQQQPTGQQPSRDSSSEKSLDALKSGIKDGSAVLQLTVALQSHESYAVKKALLQLQVMMPTALDDACLETPTAFCLSRRVTLTLAFLNTQHVWSLQAALADVEVASAVPSAKLCKALLRSFDNRTEACRDMAVSCLTQILQLDPDLTLSLLPYVMPVLVERMQCDEVSTLQDIHHSLHTEVQQHHHVMSGKCI